MTLICGLFVWLLGLSVGSFLNVVVFRLPRGLSLAVPRRSFCFGCRRQIAAYDNVPVLSWLLLRGRCRSCGSAISVQYPLVEAATGLAFVLIYQLLVLQPAREGLFAFEFPTDVPLLAAWLVLVAALMACSALDVVSYTIDVRVTDVAMWAGIALMALWPRSEFVGPLAESPWGAAALAAGVVSFVMLRRSAAAADRESADSGDVAAAVAGDSESQRASGPAGEAGRVGGATLAALLLTLMGPGLLLMGVYGGDAADTVAADPIAARQDVPWGGASTDLLLKPPALALAALFLLLVLGSAPPRDADDEVHAAIADEAPQARRMALAELRWLLPAILAGAAAGLLVALIPALGDAWRGAVQATPGLGLHPLGGAVFAIHGAVVAAAAGWIIRIAFTLAFGREAFGVGDIFILAAAGAAGGADVALIGCVLAFGLAIAAWVLSLVLKRTVLIPFGPPLALGFVTALWLNRPASAIAREYSAGASATWDARPDIVLLFAALVLASTVAATYLARLLRLVMEQRQ